MSISTLTGNNGLVSKSKEAAFKTEVAMIAENVNIYVKSYQIDNVLYNKNKVINGDLVELLGKGENDINKKYQQKMLVYRNELSYFGTSEEEKKWCRDIGIKVIDMNSDEEKLTYYINSDVADAKLENQIEKSQYQYQITGELKNKIEQRLGRNIDYSIDRFYLVNYKNICPDIVDGKKFIYNSNTGIVTEVNTVTKRNTATWYWNFNEDNNMSKSIRENKDVQDLFFERLSSYNITQIYLFLNIDNIVGNSYLKDFVKNAYDRDIKVYVCIGEKNYLDDNLWKNTIYNVYDKLEQYNKDAQYNERMAGISYDAEFWVNSDYNWKENLEIRNKHIKYIKTANEYAISKNLEAIFTLPFWTVQFDCTDSDGRTINMFDEVTKTLEEVSLMIYRDNANNIDALISNIQENANKSLKEYCIKNECTLNIGVETDASTEGDNITFYEEETENPGYVLTQLNNLDNKYTLQNWNSFMFGIHHAMCLVNYAGGIDIDTSSNKISTPDDLIAFLSNTGNLNGVKYELVNDIDMTGYSVVPFQNVDEGFLGTFDGKNYTISNLTITQTSNEVGLFGKIGTEGIVKNLNIKDSKIEVVGHNVGAIAGVNSGQIYNCSNISTTIIGTQYVGGIVGRNYGVINNSFNTGNVTCENYYVGGITGRNETSGSINNVYSIGSITEKGDDGSRGAITGENIGTITKAYWLTGSCDRAIGYNTTGDTIEMNQDEMKEDTFVNSLNSNKPTLESATWQIDSQNNGFPHF